MEKTIFRCSTCRLPLTSPLSRLNSTTCLVAQDGQDYVPAGFFVIEDGSYYTQATGQYLLNPNNLVNTKYHADLGRLNGCCGLDGCDGMNVVCLNGHEIGTERSDCWMAHSTALNPIVVRSEKA